MKTHTRYERPELERKISESISDLTYRQLVLMLTIAEPEKAEEATTQKRK